MKNKTILFTVGAAIGIAALVFQQQRIAQLSRQQLESVSKRASVSQLPPPPTEARVEASATNPEELSRLRSDNEELRRQLEETEQTLEAATKKNAALESKNEDLLRPTKQDILSSTLKTSVGAGSTLLTGGYQAADGRYQFTSIQPRKVRYPDGRTVIELESRQFAVSPKVMNQLKLDDLATNAGNTIQHGIELKADEWTSFMGKISANKAAEILSAPSMTVLPGQQVQVLVGNYQMNAIATLGEDGGIGLEMRVEQPRDPHSKSQ